MERYIVQKSGEINADPNDNRAYAEASVLGYVEVPMGVDALKRAKAKAHAALGISRLFMMFWEASNEAERIVAEQRGSIGE